MKIVAFLTPKFVCISYVLGCCGNSDSAWVNLQGYDSSICEKKKIFMKYYLERVAFVKQAPGVTAELRFSELLWCCVAELVFKHTCAAASSHWQV